MPGAKRAFDAVMAGLMLFLLSPFMLAIAVMVRSDGGPAIFSHFRVGKGGRLFGCFKFRTMKVDAEEQLARLLKEDACAAEEWDRCRKLKNDPRITRVGAWLRKTSLDELPQLINVMRGDMSLVGPRPVTAGELEAYGVMADRYLSVRPGMTGPWQIGGRSDTTMSERIRLDADYAADPSMKKDLQVLAKTPVAVISTKGAR